MEVIVNKERMSQQEFEESFESLDAFVEKEFEPVDEDDEIIDYKNPCYSEIKFDDEGNYVPNFLGHDK